MSGRTDILTDVILEIFEEVDIKSTLSQVRHAAERIINNLDILDDMDFDSIRPASSKKEKCEDCEKLKDELETAKLQIQCYQKSVIQRHPGATEAWIGNDGEVRYDY